MHIPSTWVRATGKHPSLPGAPVTVWGWGDDASGARTEADGKLKRLLERLRNGEPFPDKYAYGERPLREETLHVIPGADAAEPAAMLTRNAYGAQVLNTACMLFLDIDVPALSLGDRLRRLFGGKTRAQAMLERAREQLRAQGATFRLYETARGYRVMAIDREYDPAGTDTQRLMVATGTDPAFAQLCRAQKSFRARLTPKPWRCRMSPASSGSAGSAANLPPPPAGASPLVDSPGPSPSR